MVMRLALASNNGMVASHFGRCEEYIIVNISDNKILSCQKLANPGHGVGFLPEYLSSLGITCIIAGGMGQKAKNLFFQKNIDIIVGITGNVEEVVSDVLKGKLTPGIYGNTCDHENRENDYSHNID